MQQRDKNLPWSPPVTNLNEDQGVRSLEAIRGALREAKKQPDGLWSIEDLQSWVVGSDSSSEARHEALKFVETKVLTPPVPSFEVMDSINGDAGLYTAPVATFCDQPLWPMDWLQELFLRAWDVAEHAPLASLDRNAQFKRIMLLKEVATRDLDTRDIAA